MMRKRSNKLGDEVTLVASREVQVKLERKGRQPVNVRLDREMLDRLRAVAFGKSTPDRRVTVADIIRETLEKAIVQMKGKK